jgi:hypothetical protein
MNMDMDVDNHDDYGQYEGISAGISSPPQPIVNAEDGVSFPDGLHQPGSGG